MPEVDDSETWELLAASENATHTYLKVGRLLNTCNDEDVAIGVSVLSTNFFLSKCFFMKERVEVTTKAIIDSHFS